MELCFGHGCSGEPMLVEHERNFLFGHGRSGERMLVEHKWNYGLGMDALVSVCSWNTIGIVVWA